MAAAHQVCSGEDDREAKGGDDDACREEDGELLTGVAHGVRVVHQSSRYAVRNGWEDVKKQHKEGPVLAGKEREVSAVFVSPVAFQHTITFQHTLQGNGKWQGCKQAAAETKASGLWGNVTLA